MSSTPEETRRFWANQGVQVAPHELRWRAKQPMLSSRGYTLRPRYHPGWRPSWDINPNVDPRDCEDFWQLPYFPNIIDATRDEDGRLVCLKRVLTNSQELEIATLFSRPPLCGHPSNHCVPVLDAFVDDEDEKISYIVMPFLRRMDNPPFDLVNDLLDFVDQVLEGLAFMHDNDVAHRDPAETNILMDGDSLFPYGFHPVHQSRLPNITSWAWPRSRFSIPGGIRYYLADFGLSVRIPPRQPRLVTGDVGADREVPELSHTVPYDPFKVDIFVLGNVFRKRIYDKYQRVGFLVPLIAAMTQQKPHDRPTAREALEQWRQIRQRILWIHRVCRLRGRDEYLVQTIVLDAIAVVRVAYLIAKRFAGWSLSWLSLLFA